MFASTKPGAAGEDRKARIKNHNLPILQHLYMGSRDQPLTCSVTGTPAFVSWPCVVRKQPMQRFRLDFNHIRQQQTGLRYAGTSLDKGRYGPSDIFRTLALDREVYKRDLIEFMTIMPVSTEYHSYISQSSAYGDVTLKNFKRKIWPWALRTKSNFGKFTEAYGLDFLDYEQFIDHLSDITHPPIRSRCLSQNDQWHWR
jgi:hypothetical protein